MNSSTFKSLLKTAVLGHVALHGVQSWQRGSRAGQASSAQAQAAALQFPGVTILIPAWNDAASVQAALPTVLESARHYLDQPHQGEKAVQVVVIAGGKDGTFEAAQDVARQAQASGLPHFQMEVLPQTPGGKNMALNSGLARATHDLLVFLDADTSVAPAWLTELVRPLVAGEADATTGNFEPYTRTPVSTIFEIEERVGQQPGQVTLFGGGSIAVTREVLGRIGGRLPEEVPVGVDYDLSQRLSQAGARLVFCPLARVQTEIAQTWPEYWRGEVRWRRAYLHGQVRHLKRDRQPRRLLGLLYLPALQAAVLSGGVVFPVVSRLLGQPARRGLSAWGWLLLWVLGRQAATPLRAYAASGDSTQHRDPHLLKETPTYLGGFLVSAAAAWQAIFTFRNLSRHFKGQRPDRPQKPDEPEKQEKQGSSS